MTKTRKNIYFTQRQVAQLAKKANQENLPEAEIVRRALDIYLAWDDPTYCPSSQAHASERISSPG